MASERYPLVWPKFGRSLASGFVDSRGSCGLIPWSSIERWLSFTNLKPPHSLCTAFGSFFNTQLIIVDFLLLFHHYWNFFGVLYIRVFCSGETVKFFLTQTNVSMGRKHGKSVFIVKSVCLVIIIKVLRRVRINYLVEETPSKSGRRPRFTL